jgi:hypothetical protein
MKKLLPKPLNRGQLSASEKKRKKTTNFRNMSLISIHE